MKHFYYRRTTGNLNIFPQAIIINGTLNSKAVQMIIIKIFFTVLLLFPVYGINEVLGQFLGTQRCRARFWEALTMMMMMIIFWGKTTGIFTPTHDFLFRQISIKLSSACLVFSPTIFFSSVPLQWDGTRKALFKL